MIGAIRRLPRAHRQRPLHGRGHELGGVLLDEVPGAGNRHEREVCSTQSQVPLSAPGRSARSSRPWNISTGASTFGIGRCRRPSCAPAGSWPCSSSASPRSRSARRPRRSAPAPPGRVTQPASARRSRRRRVAHVRARAGSRARTRWFGPARDWSRSSRSEAARMRQVEDDQPVGHLRMRHGEGPGDDAAPVVADDDRLLAPEVRITAATSPTSMAHVVVLDALGLVAQVVAAQVDGDDLEACRPAPASGRARCTRSRESRGSSPPAAPCRASRSGSSRRPRSRHSHVRRGRRRRGFGPRAAKNQLTDRECGSRCV